MSFWHGVSAEASAVLMTGIGDDQIADERCIAKLEIVTGGLQKLTGTLVKNFTTSGH